VALFEAMVKGPVAWIVRRSHRIAPPRVAELPASTTSSTVKVEVQPHQIAPPSFSA
jgi:hypothetical protein